MTIKELKKLSKDDFLKIEDMTEDLYNALQNSKSGYISISRVGDNKGNTGHTDAFGVGISCSISNISRWYRTSIVQSIDWENNTFQTLNSTYKFVFKEDDKD